MGFLSWVKDHIARAAHTPVAILSELHRVSVVLWHVLTGLGTLVRGAWAVMLTGAKDLGYWSTQLADATYGKLREILTVTIPNAITWTLAAAWRRAGTAIGDLRTWARAAQTYGLHYAARIVADLRAWARSSFAWTTGHIGGLLTRVTRLERRVFAILDAPEHAAAWIFAALWRHAWAYLRRYEIPIARWALRNAVGLVLHNVTEVEHVIADII